jgi:hypothetical protein
MRKFFVFLILYAVQVLHAAEVKYALNEITYESLAKNDWTDHVRAFRCLFAVEHIRSFLDFGTGRGTKFFLDNCDHVTSCEISTTSRNMTDWYEAGLKVYAPYSNWSPVHVFASENFDYFNVNFGRNYRNKRLLSSKRYKNFLLEVKSICDPLLDMGHYDVAFVDPGIITRADFVKYLLGKIDIIVAHDTHDPIYGWERINNDTDYEKVGFSRGCGVTFWIKSTRTDLIDSLRKEISLHMGDAP